MGIFGFFKKNGTKRERVDITEDQFIDNTEPKEAVALNDKCYTLDEVLNYGSIDFEQRGYQDSLINPDSSYKDENINLLIIDLDFLVKRSVIYYTNYLNDLEFHIESRKDAGLIDTVNRLRMECRKVSQNLEAIVRIQNEVKSDEGLNKRIRLSYSRGFNRGLASMSEVLLKTKNL